MRIRTLTELFEVFRDSQRMASEGNWRSGQRVLLAALEHLAITHDSTAGSWLYCQCGSSIDWLMKFTSESDANDFMTLVSTLQSQARELLKSDTATEDLPGEYDGKPDGYARSRVFRTSHFLTAINRMAERVQTGLDEPETGQRIVNDWYGG
jgi:hypothetical protein